MYRKCSFSFGSPPPLCESIATAILVHVKRGALVEATLTRPVYTRTTWSLFWDVTRGGEPARPTAIDVAVSRVRPARALETRHGGRLYCMHEAAEAEEGEVQASPLVSASASSSVDNSERVRSSTSSKKSRPGLMRGVSRRKSGKVGRFIFSRVVCWLRRVKCFSGSVREVFRLRMVVVVAPGEKAALSHNEGGKFAAIPSVCAA